MRTQGGGKGAKTRARQRRPVSQRNRPFVKLKCSPANQDNAQNKYTCYTKQDLLMMRQLWNKKHPSEKIETTNPKEVWTFLHDRLRDDCRRESCWIRHVISNQKQFHELADSFAPRAPYEWRKNPNEWLSSADIIRFMKLVEKKHPHFAFLGPSPIDFDVKLRHGECVWEELCHFQLKRYVSKRKTHIGVIFNLDPHDKGGSHWVSMFIDIPRKIIFYFDSVGDPAPPEIVRFVERVSEQGRNMKPRVDFRFDQNHPVEHQKGNTECGMYSLFFIDHMLQKKIDAKYLKDHVIGDKYIEKFRKIYFN